MILSHSHGEEPEDYRKFKKKSTNIAVEIECVYTPTGPVTNRTFFRPVPSSKSESESLP